MKNSQKNQKVVIVDPLTEENIGTGTIDQTGLVEIETLREGHNTRHTAGKKAKDIEEAEYY